MNSNDELAARVRAKNEANACAREIYPTLMEIFRPLVGKKILTENGVLTAKLRQRVKNLLPKYSPDSTIAVTLVDTEYNVLAWNVRTGESCQYENGGGFSVYEETVVHIGTLDNGVLIKLTTGVPPYFRKNYTVEEIQNLRQKYKQLKKMLDEVRNALIPFAEKEEQ